MSTTCQRWLCQGWSILRRSMMIATGSVEACSMPKLSAAVAGPSISRGACAFAKTPPMPDYWRHSGHTLLDRTPTGQLALSDDFLRAYLRRPEMRPPPEACAAEHALHAALMDRPRAHVTPADL